MRKGVLAAAAAMGLAIGAGIYAARADTAAQEGQKTRHSVLAPDELKWTDAPAGLPKGAKVAVLQGDPNREGPFTMRVMLPAGYRVMPHWHPMTEHITVVSGTFYLGTGEDFDMDKASRLSEDAFAIVPVKHVHYAFVKDTTVVQIHAMGPWGITYVNPADDPRRKARK
jgi:quercetin dioxygenase-like cupin family protein